ncbi:MAG TPA: acetyl ornithine aminotransferase family protein [Gemmatimonadaceae bacterium]|nr:acetyl ornithine aminotransferase family protein [Gemmatimonadaceae bacterium]
MTKDYPRILTPPPGPRAKAIIERDRSSTATCYLKEYPLVVARGQGAMVEDVDGNRFLDFMAGIAVAATGHSHPKVVTAIQDAAAKFLHICGGDFYYEPMATLAERLAKLAPGKEPKRVFLTNSGTEAVEGSLKLARHSTRRTAFIAFEGSFHGRSYGSLSLTASKSIQRAGFGPFLPEVYHAPYGDVGYIESHLFAKRLDPRDVAAVVVEPIQGEGGYIVPPPGFLPGLRALTEKYGILLIMDEVQSGIGRTGKMFACEHERVVPDIILVAKGLASGMPLGAFIARADLMKWQPGAHGSTFGGNPVCCAAALATLDLVENEYMSNAQAMGDLLMKEARALAARHPAITDVRGRGLMMGIELNDPALVKRVVLGAFQKGLLLLGAGKSAIRFAPPLMVDEEDLRIALSTIGELLSD